MNENGNQGDLEERVEAELREALGPTRALRDQLAAERDDVIARLRKLDSVIRRLDRVLTAARPTETVDKMPKRKNSKAKTASVYSSGQVRLSVLNALREAEKPLTRNEIADRIGRSATTVGSALAVLREDESVRLAGRAKQHGKGIAPQLFALMEAT